MVKGKRTQKSPVAKESVIMKAKKVKAQKIVAAAAVTKAVESKKIKKNTESHKEQPKKVLTEEVSYNTDGIFFSFGLLWTVTDLQFI